MIDFDNSITDIGTKKNNFRQKITSKLEIYSKNENMQKVETAYSNYPCLSERVYVKDCMLHDYGWTYQTIVTANKIIVIRSSPFYSIKPQIFFIKQDNSPFEKIQIKEKCSEYKEISLEELLIEDNKKVLVCVEYEINTFVYKLYFEGLFMNYDLDKKQYQFDVGPVLFSETHKIENINDITLAYCAFSNTNEHTEFNTLSDNLRFPYPFSRLSRIKKVQDFLLRFEYFRRNAFSYWSLKKKVITKNKFYVKTGML